MGEPCRWCVSHEPVALDRAQVRVTAVVAHYEQPEDLARTLDALRRQSLAVDQVVVADDGSREPPSLPEGVELVRNEDRGFRAALARNRGAARATGNVLVLLDADTTPEPDYVEQVVEALLADPSTLVTGRRRYAPLSGSRLDLAEAGRTALADPAWLTEAYRRQDDLRADDEADFRYLLGATLAATTAFFDAVGGFDATFEAYGGEDWDLAHRWWVAGGRLRHVPRAVAWHDGPDASVRERTWGGSGIDARTVETTSIAERITTRPAAWRGLIARTPRVVLTHDPAVDLRSVLLTVDSLAQSTPHWRAEITHDLPAVLADPRVVAQVPPAQRRAALVHVHLRSDGLLLDQPGWDRLVQHPPPGRLDLTSAGGVVASVTNLRTLRRSHRAGSPVRREVAAVEDHGEPVGARSMAARLGGWG